MMKKNGYMTPTCEFVEFDTKVPILTTSLETENVGDLFGEGGWVPEIDD